MEEFKFSTIEEAVADLRAGKMIVAVDDPDRENEGDLICAAEHATLANVNFMASYAKGLICMPMSKELTAKLGLEQMVTNNTDNHCTAFTVSIDHISTTTGISALERSVTAMKSVEEGANLRISGGRDTCFLWKPRRGEYWSGWGIQRLRWI